jgi:two-component system sensor histidine kinase YesM
MNETIQNNLVQKNGSVQATNNAIAKINNELLYQGLYNNNSFSIELFALNKKNYPLLYLPNHVMNIDAIKHKDWVRETIHRNGKYYWHLSNEFGIPQISLSRLIGDLKNSNIPIAVLKINIDLSKIESILSDIRLGKTGRVYLLDDRNRQILPRESKPINPSQLSFENNYGNKFVDMNGKRMMVTYRTLSQNDWKIVGLVPTDELSEKSYIFKMIIYSIAFVSFVLALFASLYLSYYISKPITSLANTMKNFDQGNLYIKVETKLKGEVGFLYRSFNDMIRMINELIQKVYISEIEKKDAELRALQAQINPHFLYNTLNSINWMALKYKAADISKMVRSLSSLLRYSLDKMDKMVSIEDELEQLNSYLIIQSIRFPDKFDLFYDIDKAILECKIIKLVLQPLVENSIIHGIETYHERCYIEIRGYLEKETVVLEVINNGNLVDLNKVEKLLAFSPGHQSGDTYGIQNVNHRIKLYYGENFGLQYQIRDNKTIAQVSIPAGI